MRVLLDENMPRNLTQHFEAKTNRLADLAPLMNKVNDALRTINNGQVVHISA